MTSGRNAQVIILLGITVLLAVLFELGWLIVQSRLSARREKAGVPPAGNRLPKMYSPPVGGRFIRAWNRNKDIWENRWAMPLRVIRAVFIGAILILAAIPSWLVVQDRLLSLQNVRIPLTELRCKLPLLCSLPLPPYFLFLALCLLAAGLLIAFFPLGRDAFQAIRAQFLSADGGIPTAQIQAGRGLLWGSLLVFTAVAIYSIAERKFPGWELALAAGMYIAGWLLRDLSFLRVWQSLCDNRQWLVACLLAHAALVATLAVYFTIPKYIAVPLVFLGLAAVFLFRVRSRVPPVFWIWSLGLTLFSININSWWVSVVGDEYGFYVSARYILEKTGIGTVAARIFDEMGVYGQNPYLDSVVQSLFLRVFGTTSFGWRFSSIYPAALSIPFFYLFFREFLSRRVALGACFFLAVSEYLIDFSKIGYVSLQSLFALSVSLAAAAWAVRSGRKAAFAATGAILAMNFFFYGIAIVAILLAGLLLLWFVPPVSRPAWRRWGALAGGFGLLVFPLAFQPAFWKTGFSFTVFGDIENNASSGGIVQILFNRVFTSLFSYLYAPNESHFVAVSFVDGLGGLLVGIGFFAILYQIRRNRFAAYFLAGWGILLAVAGVLGSPALPSTTRMFVVLPWWAAAAAIGLQWILDRIPADTRLSVRMGWAIAGAVFLAAMGINLYQATVVSRARWVDRLPFEAYVQHLAEATRNHSSGPPGQFVFLASSDWSLEPFLLFQKIYPQWWTGVELQKVTVDGTSLPETALPLATDSRSILLVEPTLPEPWQEEIRVSLLELGEQWCPVYTLYGKWIFDLYVPKGEEWVCSVAG
jgi:hypothetical protein